MRAGDDGGGSVESGYSVGSVYDFEEAVTSGFRTAFARYWAEQSGRTQ